ncbi:hypothetical protein OFR43_06500 [Brachyspira hyodysenteriae]|uniref:hypothetical protein n=1 Tax=Brachyspira hyodysenteriae TaxID=159 RepID=UPI0022CD6059|nr:hypothetical protein [Brachyspira hyodysenteriae]MDA0037439.1 hypothetical protein [Brachyspira hyodysenteriae]
MKRIILWTRPDQTRPDQTRPDQTRPDQKNNYVNKEIKNLRNDIKSYDTYLDNLSEDFIKIDLRIEKLENQIQDFLQKMKEDKDKKENELKEIKKSLEGNITVDTLHKFQKAVVGIAGLLTAIGTIVGAIFYFTK